MPACALQKCLSRNTYSPDKCDEYVRKLYLCCLNIQSESNVCPGKPVIDRWLKKNKTETTQGRP